MRRYPTRNLCSSCHAEHEELYIFICGFETCENCLLEESATPSEDIRCEMCGEELDEVAYDLDGYFCEICAREKIGTLPRVTI